MSATTRPEPVARAGAIAGAVAGLVLALGVLARAVGWLATDVDVEALALRASDVVLAAGALWATAAPLLLALRARAKVTPLDDPRDVDGNPLGVLVAGGPTLTEVLELLEHVADLVAAGYPERTGTAAPATSSTAPGLSPPHNNELGAALLYEQLVDELAGGPPTVELEAVRVTDTPPVPAPATARAA